MNDKEYILRGVCPDSLGLVAKVSNFLNEHNLFIKESAQLWRSGNSKIFYACQSNFPRKKYR